MREGSRFALGAALTAALIGTAIAGQDGQITARPEEIELGTKQIPFETQYVPSRDVGAGRFYKSQEGVPGEIINVYKLVADERGNLKRVFVRTRRVEPIAEIFKVGKSGHAKASRGSYVRSRVLQMNASAYDPSAGRGRAATFRTKTGERAQYGVVAVDPRIIPLNTMVFVENYGIALACDVGRAIKGNKIDLCMNTRQEAMRFGRKAVRVHVLKSR